VGTRRIVLSAVYILAALSLATQLPQGAGAAAPARPNDQPSVQAPAAKIDPQVLAETADGRTARFLVLLADRADLRTAQAVGDSAARGRLVYEALTRQADQSQASIRAALQARGTAYRAFWIANAIAVTGDRALVDLLAARADVRAIEAIRTRRPTEPAAAMPDAGVSQQPGTAWGVERVNAPQVWAMGFRGQGLVIGIIDTGA
jgi:hypothetical protein